MPSMPRLPGKPTKIAYGILGKPANMRAPRSRKQIEINKRLVFEETSRVK